jgi:hypothetical protein
MLILAISNILPLTKSMDIRGMGKRTAFVGVADHCGWAVLMTVTRDGTLLDRRRIELVEGDLPRLPHHHDCQGLPVSEAVALVQKVRRSADACAKASLDALAAAVSAKIAGIVLRVSPRLPPTIAERIADYRSQNVADTVMYRDALAGAAKARGWSVHHYDARRVHAEAAAALGGKNLDELLSKTGNTFGAPWQKDHRVAMAAAIATFGA